MTQKKYEFTGEVKIEFGVKLHRIYFSSTSFEYSRKDCIAEFISFGQPWQRLRKRGYRCVKVEVKEIK